MSGHGVSVADLLLSLAAIQAGMLALPFKDAVATGEGITLSGQRLQHGSEILSCCIAG